MKHLAQFARDGAGYLCDQMALLGQGGTADGGVQVHRARIDRAPVLMRGRLDDMAQDRSRPAHLRAAQPLLGGSPALIDFLPEEFA